MKRVKGSIYKFASGTELAVMSSLLKRVECFIRHKSAPCLELTVEGGEGKTHHELAPAAELTVRKSLMSKGMKV